MNKLIIEQLAKVEKADLSHFNKDTNTYSIPKKQEIKLELDHCYLIHLRETIFHNETLRINWNGGSLPKEHYLKVDVSKTMPKMIKVVAVGYDFEAKKDLSYFWSGWLTTQDIDIIQKL